MNKWYLVLCIAVIVKSNVEAQTDGYLFVKEGYLIEKYGATFSMNPEFFEAQAHLFITKKLSVNPFFGLPVFDSNGGAVGVRLQYFLFNESNYVPYVFLSGGYGSGLNGFAGVGTGLEYFIKDNFSVGAELMSRFTFIQETSRMIDLINYRVREMTIVPAIRLSVYFDRRLIQNEKFKI